MFVIAELIWDLVLLVLFGNFISRGVYAEGAYSQIGIDDKCSGQLCALTMPVKLQFHHFSHELRCYFKSEDLHAFYGRDVYQTSHVNIEWRYQSWKGVDANNPVRSEVAHITLLKQDSSHTDVWSAWEYFAWTTKPGYYQTHIQVGPLGSHHPLPEYHFPDVILLLGPDETPPLFVDIAAGPSVLYENSQVKRHSVVLTCRLGTPINYVPHQTLHQLRTGGFYQWSKSNDASGVFAPIRNHTVNVLTLSNTTVHDTSYYRCAMVDHKGHAGAQSNSVEVVMHDMEVHLDMSHSTNLPISVFPPIDYFMPVTVSCSGRSWHPFNLTLSRVGHNDAFTTASHPTTANEHGSHVAEQNFTLRIAQVNTKDVFGKFQCRADTFDAVSQSPTTTPAKEIHFIREHLVQMAPFEAFVGIDVTGQDSLQLQCNFTGYPKPEISWQFSHTSWSTGYVEKPAAEEHTFEDYTHTVYSILYIPNFNATQHEGWYECTGKTKLQNGMTISDRAAFAVRSGGNDYGQLDPM